MRHDEVKTVVGAQTRSYKEGLREQARTRSIIENEIVNIKVRICPLYPQDILFLFI